MSCILLNAGERTLPKGCIPLRNARLPSPFALQGPEPPAVGLVGQDGEQRLVRRGRAGDGGRLMIVITHMDVLVGNYRKFGKELACCQWQLYLE